MKILTVITICSNYPKTVVILIKKQMSINEHNIIEHINTDKV